MNLDPDDASPRAFEWPLDRLLAEIGSLLADPARLPEADAHLLAERAAFKANAAAGKGERTEALDWASISIKTYEALVGRSDPGRAERFLDSAMGLRANLIGKFGAMEGDPVLDGSRLREWFLAGLTLDAETAKGLAAKRKELTVESLRELRRIKNRIRAIRPALDSVPLSADPELDRWKELEKTLP
jgi:hypothetical protein